MTKADSCSSQTAFNVLRTGNSFEARQLITTLEILTKEIYNHLGSTGQTIFFLGEGIQRLAVAATFDFINPETWMPTNILRLSSTFAGQVGRISQLFTSPQAARLAWQELQNKIEVVLLVRNLSSLLGISPGEPIDLPRAVEKAYSLPSFQALWAVEGLGHEYAASVWQHRGPQQGLLWKENADVPENSLLMLHAGLGLFLADWLLGSGTPTLVASSSPSQFRQVIAQFVNLARQNARPGYLGPVIESLGLVTREVNPDMVGHVDAALNEVAPDLSGYYWHGVGRALYFSRRYFLPVLSTVWCGIPAEARTPEQRQNAMAGVAWAVVLVNMRNPEILESVLQNNIADSPLQEAFANGVASSIVMRQDTTPDEPAIGAFCGHHPTGTCLSSVWSRLVASPCSDALNKYYPVLRQHHALEQVFRYQDLAALVAQLQGGFAMPRVSTDIRAVNPWIWQDALGFSQAIDICGGQRVVYCAGQTSVNENGMPLYPNDMARQINQALDNLETVLITAGLTLANIVRLNYYTTDLPRFSQAGPTYAPRLAAAGCKPAATAIGVTTLFRPELMIEIEAIAVT